MKKANINNLENEDDEMLPEYDFSGKEGERGKYYRAYRQGHLVKVQEADGTFSVQYFSLEDGAVLLEPDVREYFPTSESVNKALRSLIELIPKKSARQLKSRKSRQQNVK